MIRKYTIPFRIPSSYLVHELITISTKYTLVYIANLYIYPNWYTLYSKGKQITVIFAN